MKNTTWLALGFVAVVLGVIVYSTFHQERVRCQVCMSFAGRRDCRTASAATREEAQRTAISNACAQLSSGVTETTQCENTRPESVDWLH
ncbi:MAG: hypothetical protein C5B51_19550 [Terriglobia bacterium]|nr:MAG: hypothetical protein C5B51_19550 [Terriglobia bacterium]